MNPDKVNTIIYDSNYDLTNENRYLNSILKKNSHITYFVKCNNTPDVHCDNAMYTYNSDIITHIKGTSETIAHKLQPYDICINGSMMLNNECQRQPLDAQIGSIIKD